MHAVRRRPGRATTLLALVCAAAALLLTSTASAAAAEPRPAAPAPAVYEAAPCVVELPLAYRDDVRCGYLTVPQKRTDDADPERTIRLPVAVIPSRSIEPVDDPLVVPTSGVPGEGAMTLLDHFARDAYWANADRDVILVGQRGDAFSEPALTCPELEAAAFTDEGALLTGDESDARRLRQLQRCHDRLIAEGVDLSAYTSAAAAADLADLRSELGYDAWNLYGVSYGSRLALTVMRDQPEGLRAVILDGVLPPNIDPVEIAPAGFDAAVEALAADCAADERCDEAYPDLAATIGDVLDAAASGPAAVTVDHPVDGTPTRVDLTDDVLASGLRAALADSAWLRALPFVFDQLARDNPDVAVPLAQSALDSRDIDRGGLALSLACAEEAPFTDPERVAEAVAASSFATHLPVRAVADECAIWDVPALGEVENAAVSSDVPVLILRGSFDPLSPPAAADAAAAALAQQTTVVLPHGGHGALDADAAETCPGFIAAEFLRDPTAPPDTDCTTRMPAPAFLTPDDVDPTSALFRLDRDVIQDRDVVSLATGATTLVLMAATVLYGIGYGTAWLVRRRGGAPEGAVLAASVAAGANLAFAGGLAVVAATTDPLVLAFGLPPAAWPLFVLPFTALASTTVLVVLLVRAWAGGDGALGDRLVLSASALASLGFAAWLLARGLLLL